MAEAVITGGVVLVDDEDLSLVLAHNWYVSKTYGCRGGYVMRSSDKAYLHRLLSGCTKGDGVHVDHHNHDKLDNRKANLRPGSVAANAQNANAHHDAASSIPGVYPFRGKWQASFMRNGKRQHVGTFATEAAAVEALAVARG